MASYFQALSEPTRLTLLNLLRGGERSAGELAQLTGFTIANVSRHLTLLCQRGLVMRESRGTSAFTASPTTRCSGCATCVRQRPSGSTATPANATCSFCCAAHPGGALNGALRSGFTWRCPDRALPVRQRDPRARAKPNCPAGASAAIVELPPIVAPRPP